MTAADWTETLLFAACLLVLAPLIGRYMYLVYEGRPTLVSPLLSWLEKSTFSLLRIDPKESMNWKDYAKAMLSLNLCAFFFLFLLLLFQHFLPLNPQNFEGLSWPLAFNIAVSATTGTGWQSYAPETTLSYFSQMFGLTTQNFASAATGMTTMVALARGITSKMSSRIGNFWVDFVRSIIYVLLPFSMILAIILMSQGVIQNFKPYLEVKNLEGTHQIIPFGPVASQIASRQISSSGSGYFQASTAHPYENPTRISNFLSNLSMMLIAGAMPFAFGHLVRAKKHGFLLFCTMFFLWMTGFFLAQHFESQPHIILDQYHNLEGKEIRFGITRSVLWGATTTATSCGTTNAVLQSLTPIAGGVCLFNMMVRGVIFGPPGVGLTGIVMFSFVTLFIAGLLVGRTSEYLENRIENRELRWAFLSILIPAAVILLGSSLSCTMPAALSRVSDATPNTLMEIIYTFTSCTTNNGSAFAGLNTNTFYYQIALSIAMILGRISFILSPIIIAGSLSQKRRMPHSIGRLKATSKTFALLLTFAVIMLGFFTYFPALSLGPILEQFLLKERLPY